ncbi:MAG: hypothetical protein L0227_18280 [Chloroflexi bacterium]|nr:hypothetical protein [Chloroflexota bacterium]
MNARAILIGGIVASLAIAMREMAVEAVIPYGAGLFGPPMAIGATIVRDLQGSANPIPLDLAALVLGLAAHLTNSVVLAAAFGVLIGRRALGTSGLAAAGVAWGVAVFAAMWFVAVPAIDPLVLNLNGIAFLAGHMMWGAALALLWSRFGVSNRSYSLRAA